MDISKKQKIFPKVIFLYLVLFPFGQLLRIERQFLDFRVVFNLIDVIVFTSVIFYFLSYFEIPKVFGKLISFFIVCIFSLLLSLHFYKPIEVFIGSLYFLRLFSYSTLFLLARNTVKHNPRYKFILFNGLIVVSMISAIFGWIQYFALPDLTFLKTIGWDDHMNRLVGTFLDPTYTGIILVFGFLLTLTSYLKAKNKVYILFLTFFATSIAFTYSRASYLALIAGSTYFLKDNFKRLIRYGFIIITIFIVVIVSLPRPEGEGVRLERTASIQAKVVNYQETLQIIKKYPLFGVGYNNLCFERLKTFGGEPASHACAGSDSSILFILATTGVVGLIIFINFGYFVWKNLSNNFYTQAFKSSIVALFIHSLFVNSLFYPWVMGWILLLLALSIKHDYLLANQ